MKEKLLNLFPEFSLITSEELRDKALAVWIDAIERGGWEIKDLEEIPFTLLIANCPVNIVQHVRAVTRVAIKAAEILSEQYGEIFNINRDYLIAGGLLHDIGKLLEFQREKQGFKKSASGKLLRHPFSGAGLATKHGLPDEVVHIIATHAKEGEGGYRSPEALIVHHADFMNFEILKELLENGGAVDKSSAF